MPGPRGRTHPCDLIFSLQGKVFPPLAMVRFIKIDVPLALAVRRLTEKRGAIKTAHPAPPAGTMPKTVPPISGQMRVFVPIAALSSLID